MQANKDQLLYGPYTARGLRRGDRTTRLYRDAEVIPSPRSRAIGHRGGEADCQCDGGFQKSQMEKSERATGKRQWVLLPNQSDCHFADPPLVQLAFGTPAFHARWDGGPEAEPLCDHGGLKGSGREHG
jgi:hypothetical protein